MTNEKISKDICHHSHSIFLDNFIRKLFQSPEKILKDYINKGDSVIDIGCGPGFFTIEMAKMVGEQGNVTAVDLQPEMLERVKKKSDALGLANRISLHQCRQDILGISKDLKADFILAYYMVHETPDHESFLKQTLNLLKKGGRFLIVEPRFHVTKDRFQKVAKLCEKVGFRIIGKPSKKGGRSLLLSV